MKYGLIEFRRTTKDENTDWDLYIYHDGIDREEPTEDQMKPWNSLFWHFPETISDEEAIELMLEQKLKEVQQDYEWGMKTFWKYKDQIKKYKGKK